MRRPHPNARILRKNMPPAERRMWYFLRNKQLGGYRFRRQHTIGRYISDFVCVEAHIVIELDGEQHGFDEAAARDKERDAYLQNQGFQVLRFWNDDVYNNIDCVLEAILDAAANATRTQASLHADGA